jgi:hypothetical protein
MARPRKKIDIEQLQKCAEKQWSDVEIAAFFRVSVKTLHRRYVQLIEEAKQRGKTKLRDLQWKRALEGSDKMIIHMSKHYLGQHDKMDIHETFEPLILNMPLSGKSVTVTKKGAEYVGNHTPAASQLPPVPVLQPEPSREDRD